MIAGGPIAVGLCAVTYFVLAPDEVLYRQEIRQGNDLVRNIEKFRQERGHLPGSMDDLPISAVNVESVFYDKCSESHCVVWFGTRLGESMTYTSEDRKWHDVNVPCGK